MGHGRHSYVCVPCRRVTRSASNYGVGSSHCPSCGKPMESVSYRWRAPKRTNNAAWRAIAAGQWLWDRRVLWRRKCAPYHAVPWYERAPKDSRGRPAKHRPKRTVADRQGFS